MEGVKLSCIIFLFAKKMFPISVYIEMEKTVMLVWLVAHLANPKIDVCYYNFYCEHCYSSKETS